MKAILGLFLCFLYFLEAFTQVEITPQGSKGANIFLQTTIDVSQTGTPTLSQLIYNSNSNVMGAHANGTGYYFWNGANWQSLDANIPAGTVVFSETHPNQALLDAGFAMIGTTQITTPALDVWRKINMQNAPIGSNSIAAAYLGKFYFFGSTNNGRGFYDPETDQWTKIDSLNAPLNSNYQYTFYKERVVALDQNNLANSRIYNPSTNTWINISTGNAPTNLYFGGTNNTKNRNFIFSWDAQGSKVLDLINNTWTDVSTTNAPTIPTDVYPQLISLETKVMLYFLNNNVYEFYMYDVTDNTWTSVSNTNAPLHSSDNEWGTAGLQNDSLILFCNYYYQNNSSTTFKRYDVSQNLWLDNIASINSSNFPRLTFLGNIGDKYYFRNFALQLAEFNNTTNQWKIIQRHEDDVEDRFTGGNFFVIMCNSKIIKFGGFSASPLYWHNDGYLYDTESENWKYISSVFGRSIPNNSLQNIGAYCCNDKYFISFSNVSSTRKSGVIQLSGPTNQTTKKTLYLYRKN